MITIIAGTFIEAPVRSEAMLTGVVSTNLSGMPGSSEELPLPSKSGMLLGNEYRPPYALDVVPIRLIDGPDCVLMSRIKYYVLSGPFTTDYLEPHGIFSIRQRKGDIHTISAFEYDDRVILRISTRTKNKKGNSKDSTRFIEVGKCDRLSIKYLESMSSPQFLTFQLAPACGSNMVEIVESDRCCVIS